MSINHDPNNDPSNAPFPYNDPNHPIHQFFANIEAAVNQRDGLLMLARIIQQNVVVPRVAYEQLINAGIGFQFHHVVHDHADPDYDPAECLKAMHDLAEAALIFLGAGGFSGEVVES